MLVLGNDYVVLYKFQNKSFSGSLKGSGLSAFVINLDIHQRVSINLFHFIRLNHNYIKLIQVEMKIINKQMKNIFMLHDLQINKEDTK